MAAVAIPLELPKVPAGHSPEHEEEPEAASKLPRGQFWQVSAPGEANFPGEQAWGPKDPAGHMEPNGQGMGESIEEGQ